MGDTPDATATVYLTKVAAAERQLNAAIRMHLSEEDELAVHTIASAAYRILRDLGERRGLEHPSGILAAGLFQMAAKVASGRDEEVEADMIASDALRRTVRSVSEGIARGEIKGPHQIEVAMNLDDKKRYWNSFSAAANFLKHADRDHAGALSLHQVDNDKLLLSAGCAYIELLGTTTPEITALGIYQFGDQSDYGNWTKEMKTDFSALSPGKRRRLCLALLRDETTQGGHPSVECEYFENTDTVIIRLASGKIADTNDVATDIVVGFDEEGCIVVIQIENARQNLPAALISAAT